MAYNRTRKYMFRSPTPLYSMIYRGFKITLLDNHFLGWKYEWEIRPLTGTARSLTEAWRKEGWVRVMKDPTSHRTQADCIERAVERVSELCNPFWHRR